MVGWLPVAFVLQSFDFSESMCEDVEEEEEEEEKKRRKKKQTKVKKKKKLNVKDKIIVRRTSM